MMGSDRMQRITSLEDWKDNCMVTKYGSGDRFKQAIEQIGISQKELAAVLGVSPDYLSLIMTSNEPISEPIALKMEKFCGISASWLLNGIGTDRGEIENRLRSARYELGLSRKDMAAQLGISNDYLKSLELGRQPVSFPVAMKMEKLFGFRAEWILFGTGPKKTGSDMETD